ncbi:hypothetical protein GCM10009632_18800 [Mycolicibacterium alvei]|uniref:PE-PGRS family protein n=2 Tax=Mycolicibacterium alvei TaxID=67081 RepID=A0A6N4UYU2_9MYCO|nr:hypothetical protein MALV_38890 [Mycolicibacterium alvei]
MDMSLRPYATAGIALVGAGVIAITPIAPPPTDVQVANPAVNLAASVNPIAPWVDAFNETSANATTVTQVAAEAPGAALQQAIVNQFGFLDQLLNNPGSIGPVLEQFGANLQKAFQAATLLGVKEQGDATQLLIQSNDFMHVLIASAIPVLFEPTLGEQGAAILTEVVRFLASPASGILIGMVGPVISPAVATLNSVLEISGALGAGNFEDALQALVAMPANVVGSVFNGATLNLDVLLPLVSQVTPPEFPVTSLSMAFGGLLTPGNTGGLWIPEGGTGGSIINSLGVGALGMEIVGNPVGPIGAMVNLSQMIAKAIGWDGTGNPLTKLTFPSIDSPAAPAGARVAPKEIQVKAAPPAVDDITSDPTANEKPTVTIKLDDKAGPEVTATGATSEEVSDKGTTAEAPVAQKVKKPTLRQNPLSRVQTALDKAGDRAENIRSDIGKKLKIKSPKKAATKSPAADKAGDSSSDKSDSGNAA